MTLRLLLVVAGLAALPAGGASDAPRLTDAFPPEEFAARRARVLEAIGDGIAVLQGAGEPAGFTRFRQNNQFFYLTGVEAPQALLLLDGGSKTATLYLPPWDEQAARWEGPRLVPGAEAARLTGIHEVLPRDAFAAALRAAATQGRRLFVPHRPEGLGATTPHSVTRHAEAVAADPWDGRRSRAARFVERLAAEAPGAVIADLDPTLDRLRLVKSPREIALLGEATRLATSAIAEVIRSAAPGSREHELEAIADYVFRQGGAQGAAYFALSATGANTFYPHYHGGRAELKAGDLVLFDYGPDYKYYASDVTRLFPASGRFTPLQRERYTVYLRMYQALVASIRPGISTQELQRQAAGRMDAIAGSYPFSNEATRLAARALADAVRSGGFHAVGHMVGMAVHDVHPPFDVLEPGMAFTVEPAMIVEAERVYIRLEDLVVVTPGGVEVLSGALPVEPEAIEALMAETGRFEPTARGTR